MTSGLKSLPATFFKLALISSFETDLSSADFKTRPNSPLTSVVTDFDLSIFKLEVFSVTESLITLSSESL